MAVSFTSVQNKGNGKMSNILKARISGMTNATWNIVSPDMPVPAQQICLVQTKYHGAIYKLA